MLSAAEIAGMRAVQAEAWPDTCTLQRSVQTTNAIGEAVVSWETVASDVECRLARSAQQPRQTPLAQQQTVIGQWMLTVATSLDIRSGDRVVVAGATYEIVDVAAGFEWETARRCDLREVERG